MVTLTRLSKASMFSTQSNSEVPELTVSELFNGSFKPVAEVLAVLSGSPTRAEAIVAAAVGEMASPNLSTDADTNTAVLIRKSLAALGAEWAPSPTPSDQRHSPTALLRSLPFEEAGVFVLENFGGFRRADIAKAMSCPLPRVRSQLERATASLRQRFNTRGNDLIAVFNRECEDLAMSVLADPKHLVVVLLDMAVSRTPETRCSCQALRIPPMHRSTSSLGS